MIKGAVVCKVCGSSCREEFFDRTSIREPCTLFICSNSTALGGTCDNPANLTLKDWNSDNYKIPPSGPRSLQERKHDWMVTCFDKTILEDHAERNRRFLEEAAEVVQAAGMSREEAHFMIDYVFDRPKGDVYKEAGGALLVLMTLATLHGFDLLQAGEAELRRIWPLVEKIREKHKTKPIYKPKRKWWRLFL